MGLFDCCFAQPAVDAPRPQSITTIVEQQPVPVTKQQQPEEVKADNTVATPASAPPATDRESDWSKSWSNLNQTETTAVKQTLLKVSELIERFAEGSAEREAPVHALKKALQLVAVDCHASYASMSVVSSDQQSFLVMGCVGSSHEATTLPNLVAAVTGSDSSVERLLKIGSAGGGADAPAGTAAAGGSPPFSWTVDDGVPPPSDWVQLQQAGIRHVHAMAIRAGPDQLLGVLNLGFKHEPCLDMGSMGPHLFGTYMSLVSATLTAVVRDPGLNAYVCLARDLAAASSLDGIMQAALLGSRAALTRLKGLGSSTGSAACGAHTWLRLALISGDKSAAALFDDLSQAGVTRTSKRSGAGHSGSSAQWVATIQAAGGLVRTNIPMKNTILRIALTNKKQVLIPDVQKLINQLGNVNTDLFASRLLRPPSSVLLLPLRASGVGIYGALYCLADVHTEFSEVAKQLKEVAELLGAGLNRMLSGPLSNDYMGIQQLNHEQLLVRESTNESGNSLGAITGAAGHSSGIYGGAITPSTVTPATTAGSLPTGTCSYSTTTASSSLCGAAGARSEGSFMAAATAGGALEFGSTVGTHASWTGSMGGSMCSMGGSFSGAQGPNRSFTTRQVASSTNAVATGITEKLNQKRIDAAMHDSEDETLTALQLVAQIGEGGFAKVFRGLYRGLVVAVKVVAVGDPSNERAVMKNAHEIAILRSSSHPNIIQAYSCMMDVHIRDVIALCTRQAPRAQRQELIAALTACCGNQQQQQQRVPTGSGGSTIDDATCHIEVVEYCDLGNLTSAIRNQIFSLAPATAASSHNRHLHRGSRSSRHSGMESAVGYDSSTDGEGSCASEHSMLNSPSSGAVSQGPGSTTGSLPARLRVNMRWLLLTLLEVAEGMAYLHRMGVVHCDMKPANVLLKSSNADVRGFTAKVSDFGLSRVEDDDTCATFPFNSCGTAAYVAPEALITTKKVNASVDVYAFGVMMWELFVGQRPYGNMSQQKVVEEVVLRGLRPCFPVGTPPGYAQLAASCWHATANARPTFQEVTARLQVMLHQAEESEAAAAASCSLTGSEAWGGRADGLGTPPASLLSAANNLRGSSPGMLSPSGTPQGNTAAARPSIPRSRAAAGAPSAGPAGGGGSEANAAAAAAIAEAAAAWQKQHSSAGKIPGQRVSFDAGRPGGMQPAAGQQLQAAQLLQWQQQQQLLLQQEHQALLQNARQGRASPDDPAAVTAAKAAVASGGEPYQRAASAGQPIYQQQAATAAALAAAAAAGSIYEFQQVGFGGETVVGTGSTARSRYGSGGGGTAADMSSAAQQQQQLLQAAIAAGYGGQARRGPSRSKTFTAGTGGKQAYEQLLATMSAQTAAAAGGSSDAGASGSGATSLSFNYAASSDQQQQQVLMMQQQLQILQRQQQVLQQHGGYNAAAGLLAGQPRQLQQQFTFAAPAGGSYSGTAGAFASFQQQQQQQLTLNAARDLLARQAASMQAVSSNQHNGSNTGTPQQQQQ